MFTIGRISIFLAVVAAAQVACATGAPGAQPAQGGAAPVASATRTLVVAARYEPDGLPQRSPREGQINVKILKRAVNAELASLDDRGEARPYLAETLPQLGTDTWRVLPDGRMETSYRLKPNLTWHDGAPLTADDYVMAFRIFATPALGLAASAPFRSIENVHAPDPRTVVIRWKQLYPDVTFTTYREFTPMPKHILEELFAADQGELFANDSYWNREFIGAGPYKLDRWEPGAFIEMSAFDGHALGKPKIDRLRFAFIADQSAAMAHMLSGEMHLSDGSAIGGVEALLLKKEWDATRSGDMLFVPAQWRASHFQLRSDISTPAAISDARVRKALAHAVDKHLFNQVLYADLDFTTDTFIAKTSTYGELADRAIVKYPLDLRRTESLMAEAGYARGTDGMYISPTAGRFVGDAKTNSGRDNELETSVLASMWRQVGFEFGESVLTVADSQDAEVRASYPSVFTTSMTQGETAMVGITSDGIPTAQNRWRGNNRGSWSNPEYDRLVTQLESTLDAAQRGQLVAQIARVHSEDLPAISLFFRPLPYAYTSAVRGIGMVPPEGNVAWNIHDWELR
ncbi:MAG: hypothetical protein HW416_270 [Chloroflexi bacterium]|nr:hypothetical protein [Chloroflexota bacterium]